MLESILDPMFSGGCLSMIYQTLVTSSQVTTLADGTKIFRIIKDGAYFCYCAYVLRISKYSGFLWVMPTNKGIFCAV